MVPLNMYKVSVSITWLTLTFLQCGALPNFVFMMADDMGWGDVSWNNGNILTSNLEAMAASPHTIVFQRGYSGSPLCSPTRASVLTGRSGDRECIYSANPEGSQTLPLPLEVFTIAEAVKKADSSYQTALVGKWHLGDFYDKEEGNPHSSPTDSGFDHWFATERNGASTTTNCRCEMFKDTPDTCVYGRYNTLYSVNDSSLDDTFCREWFYPNDTDSDGVTLTKDKLDRNYNNDTDNERDAYFIVTKFEEYLETFDLSKPFLAVLWFHGPHIPYIATPEITAGCLDGTYCKTAPNGTNYTAAEVDYYGSVIDIDIAIGRIRQLLKDYNVYENTFVSFTSDNGPQRSNPGSSGGLRGVKDDVWEGGIRVPTIMQWPDVIPNGSYVSDFPVVTHDLLPTILDVLNIESDTPDFELDGISIMDTLRSGGIDGKNRSKGIGFTYLGGGLSLAWVDNEWKYVKNSNHCDGDECDAALYNLKDDPYETNDVSSTYPQIFERMDDEAHDWFSSVVNSQLHDTKCVIDRLKSYQEYVIIGIIAGSVALCCIILLVCVGLRMGWFVCRFSCWCCAKVMDDLDDEIEMAENTDAHEKTKEEETINADTTVHA